MPETTDPDISSLSEQAAQWAICLSDNQISNEQRANFEAWLAQDPRHRIAFEQVDHLWHSVTPRKQRSYTGIKTLLSIALLLGGLYGLPLAEWLADESTGVGEVRRITLADGSRITLDSDSAADIVFDMRQRRIILQRGRLLAEVAPDSLHTPRPFIVENRDGTAKALGTRYIVEQTGHDSIVNVIESEVAVANHTRPDQTVTLQSGQSLRFDKQNLRQPETMSPFAASWIEARLVYQDAPLTQVIADLARYRKGFMRINEAAGQLRFTGVLPADDPEAALSILENALPIQTKRHSKWFIRIDLQT
ncbi:MAG: FecR family protein [Nitrosomonas sp.]|nr:MAG: FecR family protein [Nitrosomonas sp.]UJP08479.1 MAG: FecR family protein [Nitrosomonas sp.]